MITVGRGTTAHVRSQERDDLTRPSALEVGSQRSRPALPLETQVSERHTD